MTGETGRVEPLEVVRRFWQRIDARDWTGLAELLDDDVVLELPATGERVRGPEGVVAVNAEYPEGWEIRVLRLLAAGDVVVSEVEVPLAGVGVFRVASFTQVAEGRVAHVREYWTQLGVEEAPEWRRRWSEPLSQP